MWLNALAKTFLFYLHHSINTVNEYIFCWKIPYYFFYFFIKNIHSVSLRINANGQIKVLKVHPAVSFFDFDRLYSRKKTGNGVIWVKQYELSQKFWTICHLVYKNITFWIFASSITTTFLNILRFFFLSL